MLNRPVSLKEQEVEIRGREALGAVLSGVRSLRLISNAKPGRPTGTPSDPGYDFQEKVETQGGEAWWLCASAKSVGHPRHVRSAVWGLKHLVGRADLGAPVYPLVIAPYLSEESIAICKEEDVGYLDLSGNCHLEFGGIYLHVEGKPNRFKETRGIQTLFSPKASRVLRVLLQGPLRPHKVEELAAAADVSLGLVSKVRQVLLEQELGENTVDGIRIKGEAGARALLRDWLLEDDFFKRVQVREYSALTSDFTLAGNLMAFCQSEHFPSHGLPLFTMNFAAWLRAPHNVPTVVSAYLDRLPDEDRLLPFLQARTVSRGAGNLRILVPHDYKAVTIGQQHVKDHPYLPLVSDLQLFLDLHGGEPNGEEQAAVLRERTDFNGGWA